MQLDIKYDEVNNRIVCKDLESGIIGKMIRVHNPAEVSRIMNTLDTTAIISHINEINNHMQKGESI